MNKLFPGLPFAAGLLVVAWIGLGFVGAGWLPLAMTALIAAVYLLGAYELWQFRSATRALGAELDALAQPPEALAAWLERVPTGLRNAVRLRIEGERAGLPGPALTPYLVGLLVMLGMLGTFLGMLVTFRGAVFALDGSTDLQAIRAALAEPLRGLGLSFGTSVAGVAASAMLGLMSALCRRERMQVARVLDSRIATVLRPFSHAHQRQETFRALQVQAGALPEVVQAMQSLMERMEARSAQLDQQLLERHGQLQREVTQAYAELARSVGASLEGSLAAGAKAAGEAIQPVVEGAMARVAQQAGGVTVQLAQLSERVTAELAQQAEGVTAQLAQQAERVMTQLATQSDGVMGKLAQQSDGVMTQLATQSDGVMGKLAQQSDGVMTQLATQSERVMTQLAQQSEGVVTQVAAQAQGVHAGLAQLAQHQVDALSQQFGASAQAVSEGWHDALRVHARTSEALAGDLQRTLGSFTDGFAQRSAELVASLDERLARSQAAQATADQQRLQAWSASLQALDERLARTHDAQATADQQRLQAWSASLRDLATQLRDQWSRAGAEMLAQQRAAVVALEQAATGIAERAGAQAALALDRSAALLAQSEELVRTRADAEARWLEQHGARTQQLADLWRTGLAALRADEDRRGDAAVARLGELQASVAQHLASLGAALEAPLTRLLHTASEVPQAAAGVIAQLREEMSRVAERDNLALQERSDLLERLGSLLQAVSQAALEQRAATAALVDSATAELDRAGRGFAEALDAQAARAADSATQLGGSAVELASVAEAFGQGVQLFQSSSERMIEGLQRVEAALSRSTARSDEQLAYYVAQAREVIDLSIASQQGLVENLRQLQAAPAPALALADEAGA